MARKRLLLAGLGVLVCASTGSSIGQEPEAARKKASPRDAITQRQLAAYRSELQGILAKEPREFATKSGAGLELRGFDHVALAKSTPDGETERLCTDDVETAVTFLRTPAAPTKDR